MKAMVFHEPGGPERLGLEDVPDPGPGPGEVLLRVRYAGVNPLDRVVLSGAFPAKPMPHIPGSEAGGVVEAVGEGVQGIDRGREVVVSNRRFDGSCVQCRTGHEELCTSGGIIGVATQGAYAERMVVPAVNLVPLPPGVGLEGATAAALSGLTAWHLVLTQLAVAPGEWVAVFGATGGVGGYVLQLAHLAGGRVIAVTRDRALEERLRGLGAEAVVVEGRGPRTSEAIRSITGGQGASVVVDPVGRATWAESVASVAANGRWGTCGALTGADVNLNLAHLYSREVRVVGSTGGTRRELAALLDMVARRRVGVPIDAKFPLKEAPRALGELGKEDRFGKILLEVQ